MGKTDGQEEYENRYHKKRGREEDHESDKCFGNKGYKRKHVMIGLNGNREIKFS